MSFDLPGTKPSPDLLYLLIFSQIHHSIYRVIRFTVHKPFPPINRMLTVLFEHIPAIDMYREARITSRFPKYVEIGRATNVDTAMAMYIMMPRRASLALETPSSHEISCVITPIVKTSTTVIQSLNSFWRSHLKSSLSRYELMRY